MNLNIYCFIIVIFITTMKCYNLLALYCALAVFMWYTYLLEDLRKYPNYCPVSTGGFYFLTMMVTSVRSYEEGILKSVTITTSKLSRLCDISVELSMSIFGIIEMSRNCVNYVLLYYGWISTTSHLLIVIYYLKMWKEKTTGEIQLNMVPLINFNDENNSGDKENEDENNITFGLIEENNDFITNDNSE